MTIVKTVFLSVAAVVSVSATLPETRISLSLPAGLAPDARGRLLVFAEPATEDNAEADAVDIGGPGQSRVWIAARDVDRFGGRPVTLDAGAGSYPTSFSALPPGSYRVQAVLDRDGSYNYGGRGAGDLISRVATIRFPLTDVPTISFDHEVAAAGEQFDVRGLPPQAAEQITASRPHLHDEQIASSSLTRFRGTAQSVAAWVLTPPGYDPTARRTYPTVFMAGGFGATHRLDGQQLSRQWHLMETGEIPPMIWVALDFSTPTGTTEFADSLSNGPWGKALVDDVMPELEARYRMDAKPTGRFLTGHSSGGWFALWTIVRHPGLFGGSWPTSPDPVDFHDFLGTDLYAAGANLYRDAHGRPRPLERGPEGVRQLIEQAARLEDVLGHVGGQLRSFEWVFSPRRADGTPAPLFDRETGAVDPEVAGYWCERFDIARAIGSGGVSRTALDGKVHVSVGELDSFYLEGPVRRLEAAFRQASIRADVTYVPNASHSVSQVYAREGDRSALWKQMAAAMYAVARPGRPQWHHSASRTTADTRRRD